MCESEHPFCGFTFSLLLSLLLLVSWVRGVGRLRLGWEGEVVDASLCLAFIFTWGGHLSCTAVFLSFKKVYAFFFFFRYRIPYFCLLFLTYLSILTFSFLQTYFLSWQTSLGLGTHCDFPVSASQAWASSIQFWTIWTLDSHLPIFSIQMALFSSFSVNFVKVYFILWLSVIL